MYGLIGAMLASTLAIAKPDRRPIPTVISEVYVVSEDGRRTGPHDVLLGDGLIQAILPPGTGEAELRVDGGGGTLLPGLVDAHVHLESTTAVPGRLSLPAPRRNMRAMAWAGVTTVCDLSMPTKSAHRWRRRVDRGFPGPQIFSSGRPFTAPGGHPGSALRAMYPTPLIDPIARSIAHEVTDAEDVARALPGSGERQFLKVMLDGIPRGVPQIGDPALSAVREQATALNARLLAHVGSPSDVDRALDHNVDALVHIPYTGLLTGSQITRLAERGVVVMPTLTVWADFVATLSGDRRLTPLEEEILPRGTARRISALNGGSPRVPKLLSPFTALVTSHRSDPMTNLRALRAGGVMLVLGSDTPNVGAVPGAGTHRELDFMREAGLTPNEVLTLATSETARFLDPDAHFGLIRDGWEADLLLVEGDPTQYLEDVHSIREVWVDGRRIRP